MTDLPRLAISIRQPWAYLILHAGKDVENRDWPTKIRGPVCIHAAKGMTPAEYEDGIATAHHVSLSRPFPPGMAMPDYSAFRRGGIVGTAEIVGCVTDSDSPWFFGRYGFVLRNATPLPEMISVKGALGFFDWRANLAAPATPAPAGQARLL